MAHSTRVTVTLPQEVLLEIDTRERNRSKFVLEAVERELERRRKEDLERSLASPHPESQRMESFGLVDWFASGNKDAAELLDLSGGTDVRWVEGVGWTET